MQYIDKEEKNIVEGLGNGNYVSLKNASPSGFEELKNNFISAGENTMSEMNKRKAINIRIIERDISELKKIAFQEGIPYQTLITSVLHKFVTGKVKTL